MTFDRALAFISGYRMAIEMTRTEIAKTQDLFRPGSVESRFEQRLRDEGRMRWDSWSLTVLAESLGWTGNEPPSTSGLTEEQEMAAIRALVQLLEDVFALPSEAAGHAVGCTREPESS